jgi:hypothetical protein
VDRLVYILTPLERKLACTVRLTRLMKWEAFKEAGFAELRALFHAQHAEALRPEDRPILLGLMQQQPRKGEPPVLEGAYGRELFGRLLDTGRLFFATGRHVRLRAAAPEAVELGWEEHSGTRWRPAVSLRTGALPFALDPPIYLDPEACTAGDLAHEVPSGLLAQWLATSPLDEAEAARFCLRLAKRFPESHFPTPACVRLDEQTRMRPVAVLVLQTRALLGRDELRANWIDLRERLRLRLRFRYGEALIDWDAPEATVSHREGDRIIRLRRDSEGERAVLDQLRGWGFMEDSAAAGSGFFNFDSTHFRLGEPATWRETLGEVFPRLDPAHWEVERASGLVLREGAEDALYGHSEALDEETFTLELGISVEGRTVALLPLLHQALRGMGPRRRPADVEGWLREGDFGIRLEEAPGKGDDPHALSLVMLPPGLLLRLVEHVHEVFDRRPFGTDGRLRLGRWRMAELATAGLAAEAAAPLVEVSRLCERLRDGIEVRPRPAPATLRATLRPYQESGLGWLHTLAEIGAGGILADDMGLGKTVQVMAHLLELKRAGHLAQGALVVAPTSVIDNWESELARFAPDLKVGRYHGTEREAAWHQRAEQDVTLTSYALLWRDLPRLARHPWDLAILDEAQFIKNASARTARAARALTATRRLCLTGTPVENHLQDLWSLFEFLLPGFLGDETSFREGVSQPLVEDTESAFAGILRDRLRRRIAPFVLRRRKEEVLPELPEKTEVVHAVAMTPGQAERYATVRRLARRTVRVAVDSDGLAGARLGILAQLLKLRQICCDPRLTEVEGVAPAEEAESAKLSALMELVGQLQADGSRILIFSQFTTMLDLISAALRAEGREHLMLTGKTRERAALVERFQSGACPLFLISLRAGGFGLNLTAADSVIHYDPWWNPAVERQATDRSHRLGQTKPVFVYKLIVEDSIEARIQELQHRKLELMRDLLSEGDHAHLALDEDTLDFLLGD